MKRIVIQIKAYPAASRDHIIWCDDLKMFKIYTSAPREDGKANQSIRYMVADRLGLSQSSINIVSGLTTQIKKLEIFGYNEIEDLKKLLKV